MRFDTASMGTARASILGAGWIVAIGVVACAAWAVVELTGGSIDETDVRVFVTSLAFAIASTTAASGLAALLRTSPALRALGTATFACSAGAFGLFVVIVWTADYWSGSNVSDTIWRACAAAAVLAIAGGHASLIARGWAPSDSWLVRLISLCSLGAGAVDAVGALLPILGITERVSDPGGRFLAAVLVVVIATTVLAPLVRRLQEPAETAVEPGAERRKTAISAV